MHVPPVGRETNFHRSLCAVCQMTTEVQQLIENMPQNTHLAAITAENERLPEPDHAAQDPQVLHQKAFELAASFTWLPSVPWSRTFVQRGRALARDLKPMCAALESPLPELPISDDFRWLY